MPGKDSAELGTVTAQLSDILQKKTYDFDAAFLTRVIALMVQDRDFLPNFRGTVDATFFQQKSYHVVAKQILDHFDSFYVTPDKTTLKQRLKYWQAGTKAEVDFSQVIKLVDLAYKLDLVGSKAYAHEHVVKFGTFCRVRDKWVSGLRLLGEEKYEQAVKEVLDALAVGTAKSDRGSTHRESYRERAKRRKVRREAAVSTGMPVLDEALGGGLFAGQLVVLLGGTSSGKTTGACNFAWGAALTGKKVLYITTELIEDLIQEKFDAKASNIYMGQDMVDHEDELLEALDQHYASIVGDIHVKHFDPMGYTIQDARIYAQQQKAEGFNYDMIIIDTPDLFRPVGRYQKPHEGLTEIYTSCFSWAKKDGVPIVVTSDISKEHSNRLIITKYHAGGSYEKMKKADIVIGLGQDDLMRQLNSENIFKLWAHIAKARQGDAGAVLEIEVSPLVANWNVIGLVPPNVTKKHRQKEAA